MNIQFSDRLVKAANENRNAIQKFFLIFLFFTILSVLLGLLLMFCGFILLGTGINIWINVFGIIMMLAGVVFIYFYLRFIFTPAPKTTPERIKITKVDEPELFQLIYEVADQVGAQHPKNVYIIHDANASVQFASITKSLFFSKRKDLNIGLLLIKYLNKKELKGVLAHEFGHFTQSTMKINSWVFVSNVLLESSLMNREKDKSFVNKISALGYLGSLLVNLMMSYIQALEKQFFKQYQTINKTYLRLSKEMEYHADLYEVSVTDVPTFITSSVKIEMVNAYLSYLMQLYQYTLNDEDVNIELYKDLDLYLERKSGDYFNYNRKDGFTVNYRKYIEHYTEQIVFEDPNATHPHNFLRIQNVKDYKGDNLSAFNDQSFLNLQNSGRYEDYFFKKLFISTVTNNELKLSEHIEKFEYRYNKYITTIEHNKYEDMLFNFQTEAVDFENYRLNESAPVQYGEIFNEEIAVIYEKQQQAEMKKQSIDYIISLQPEIKSFVYKNELIHEDRFEEYKKIFEKEIEENNEIIKNKINQAITFMIKKASSKNLLDEFYYKANQLFTVRERYFSIDEKMNELYHSLVHITTLSDEDDITSQTWQIQQIMNELRYKIVPFVEKDFKEFFNEEEKKEIFAYLVEEDAYQQHILLIRNGRVAALKNETDIFSYFKNELLTKIYSYQKETIDWMREMSCS